MDRQVAGRSRGMASAVLVVLGSIALALALVTGWTDRHLFDSREFAARAVVALKDASVRRALAEEIADELTQRGTTVLVSFRSILLPLVEDVVGTPAFRSIFRTAVEDAHRAAISRHAGAAAIELGETIEMLTSTAVVTSPGLAQQLERQASSLLIDAAPVLDRLKLWRISEEVRWLDDALVVVTVVLLAGALLVDRDRRRAVRRLGIGVIVAGIAVALVAWLAPKLAATRIDSSSLARAVEDVASRFLADLEVLGLGAVAVGVIVAAAASGTAPSAADLRDRLVRARDWVMGTRSGQLVGGAALVLVALVLLRAPAFGARLLVWVGGALLAYTGLRLAFLACFGAPAPATTGEHARRRALPRPALGTVTIVLVVGVVAGGLVVSFARARASARDDGDLVCNGSAEYCDRRLDQIVLAGSHNSMSAAADPGWLFAENLTGIPAQLEYGIRALLVKTHYGTPTGVEIGGAELVVTNTAAEARINEQEEVAELSPEAVARAKELEATVPGEAESREIYLCHVYCTLGATKFSETLAHLKRFMDRNPGEVIVLFIGDYVSPEDTAAAFERAKLLDRVWTYDTTKPPPTLREMVEARRTLLVLAEHQGGNPPWYTKGYGIFQDTPYTFASPEDFSCAHNRGPGDAPLFELNHFITNRQPPSVAVARQVNSYDVLMGRARQCIQERGMLPNIIAVDFYDQGDLLRVVEELNENPPPLPATTVPATTASATTTSATSAPTTTTTTAPATTGSDATTTTAG